MSITGRRSAAAIDGVTGRSTGSGRARTWRRLGRAVLIVASGSAALALAGPMGLRPFVDTAEAAGAAADVAVAFVIDFGTGTTPVVGCVTVPASDNRYDALKAFLTHERMALATYAPSGLLCSINAIPSTSECGQVVAGGYVYWSYFTGGSGGWTYANTGASGGVVPGDVEGWRFQNPGKGNPGDPAPGGPSQFDSICAVGTVTTTTTTSPTVATTHPGSAPHPQGTGVAPAPGGSSQPGRGPTATPSSSVMAPTTTTTRPTITPAPSTASSTPSSTSSSAVAGPGDPVAAMSTDGHPTGAPAPGSGPLIIGGLLITALGIAAFARWRKRPRTP